MCPRNDGMLREIVEIGAEPGRFSLVEVLPLLGEKPRSELSEYRAMMLSLLAKLWSRRTVPWFWKWFSLRISK